MDVGFAPGGGRDPLDSDTGQQERVRRMIKRRANTLLVDRPGGPKSTPIGTVKGFIQHVKNNASITKPIGNVLLGGHADSEGHIFIPMFPKAPRATDFEILDDTLHSAAKSIKLTAVIGASGNHNVHFKGCNIGSVPKFLAKFKEAMGSTGVTAPKHFHGMRTDLKIGMTEFMAYEFIVRSRTQITDRDDLIAAFVAKKFKFVNGAAVPDARWQTWVPQDITTLGKNPHDDIYKFGASVGGETERAFARQFRVETSSKHPFTWDLTPSPFPATGGYLAALRADLKLADQFKDTYGFPFHERLGYPTVDAFVDGLNWTFRRGKGGKANTLYATGERWEYTAVIPIENPNIVINFHPDDVNVFPRVTQLVETDARFFGIV